MTGRPVPFWARTAVVSRAGFLLMAVYAIPSMFLSNPDLRGHITMRLAISVIALCALFAMLWIAAQTWLAQANHTYQPARVVATFVAATSIRAVGVALTFEAAGLTQGIDWAQRMLPSVIGFTTALVVVNSVLGSVVEHRNRERLLAAEQGAARHARDVVLTQIRADLQATATRIRQEMLGRVAVVSEDDPRAAADALREAADQVLRPIAQQLVSDHRPPELVGEPVVDRGVRLRGLIMSATRGRPLAPLWTAVLVMALGGPYVLSVLPLADALFVLAVGFGLVWISLTAGNLVLSRVLPSLGPGGRVVVVALVLLVAASVVAAAAPLVVDGPPDVVQRIMLGDMVLIPEMGLALIIARAAQLQQDSVLRRLQDAGELVEWQVTRARCLQWYDQRALARAMHGPVQSAVASAVMRLEQADHSADPALIAAARADIIASLDTLQLGEPRSPGVVEVLTELHETWIGVCEITWSIPQEILQRLSDDTLGSATISELAAEGCWNAIRHAVSSTIGVGIEDAGPLALRLRVVNDGPAPGTTKSGMGTQMFDEMAMDWNLQREGPLTVLTALVPVADWDDPRFQIGQPTP